MGKHVRVTPAHSRMTPCCFYISAVSSLINSCCSSVHI